MKPASRSLQDQTILVTGGAGFLGVHVARVLVERRARLILLDTASKRADLLAPVLAASRVDFVVGELSALDESAALLGLLPEVDYLVHLGLTVPENLNADAAEAESQYQAANLAPFEKLLGRLPARLKGVCLASSVSVYGPPNSQPVSETDPACGQTPYARAKLAMEAALANFGERRAVPVSALRYTTLYGPGETRSPRAIPSFMRSLLAGQPPVIHGDGGDVHDYLYVQDAAEGTCRALERMPAGSMVFNLGSGHGWTTRAVAEMVQRLMGMALPPQHMPARGPRQTVVAHIGRARETLQFEPGTPLEKGLAAELAHMRTQLPASGGEPAQDRAHGLFVRPSTQPARR